MGQAEEYIQPFLRYLESEKRYSENTLIAYQTDIKAFFDFLCELDENKKKDNNETNDDETDENETNNNETDESVIQDGKIILKNISYTSIRAWMVRLNEGYGKHDPIIPRSINRKISSLKSFFKFHISEGNLTLNPMNKIISPKMKKRLPVFIKEADISNLSNSLNVATENWKSLNAAMIISLFYATGMRRSELIHLKDTDIDFSRRQIKVFGKGNKERNIPITLETIEQIKNYQQLKYKEFGSNEPELLLTEKGKKLYPKYVYLLVKKYLSTIPTLDKKSPHVLRHSFATHLMNNGAEINAVKELLGHSSLAATQVYMHNTIEKLKEVYQKAHPKA
jgi:integrase/recombinase XerC